HPERLRARSESCFIPPPSLGGQRVVATCGALIAPRMTTSPDASAKREGGHRRDAYVTIERRVGAPRLFATAYSTVGSSIYFALGVVAAYALGLTPLVFLVASLLFVITTLTYFEGMTLHPERGGSAVMARSAFHERLAFRAGWS